MKTIFSNAENSRGLFFSPILFFNLSLPSYFALLSAIIDAAAHWYPGFLYQHQPRRLHWLCKVSIWKICYKNTARLFCLFARGFFVMFITQALKCDSEDPGCRVLNLQDHALSQQPQCWICPSCRGVFTQFTSLVSLKLELMSCSGITRTSGPQRWILVVFPHCY